MSLRSKDSWKAQILRAFWLIPSGPAVLPCVISPALLSPTVKRRVFVTDGGGSDP